jgi:hypothetical protein
VPPYTSSATPSMGSGITPSYREIWPIDYVISALILSMHEYHTFLADLPVIALEM